MAVLRLSGFVWSQPFDLNLYRRSDLCLFIVEVQCWMRIRFDFEKTFNLVKPGKANNLSVGMHIILQSTLVALVLLYE